MNESTYNFLKVKQGICHFARVKLSVESTTSSNEVRLELPANPPREDGRWHYPPNPLWIEAALLGAEEALEFVTERDVRFHRVCLLDIFGVDVDTREDAMKCAAALAIWNQVYHRDLEAALNFDEEQGRNGGHWSLNYEKLKSLTSK